LRLVRPKHACSHCRRYQRLDVTQHKDVCRLSQLQPDERAYGSKQRREVRRYERYLILALAPQERRKVTQRMSIDIWSACAE
jgi:hypothetical protein